MPSTLCPFCEVQSHVTVRWGHVYQLGWRVRFAATCDNCKSISVADGRPPSRHVTSDTTDNSLVLRTIASIPQQDLEWWPKVGQAPEVADVPEAISRAAKEAYSSASVGNHMAAILMARTVVEATAKSSGISSGVLSAKINAMKEKNLIRPAIAEQAHEVRFAGNDMAHGDIDVAPNATDSEEILALMGEVLSEVFQGPARLERIRAKRRGA